MMYNSKKAREGSYGCLNIQITVLAIFFSFIFFAFLCRTKEVEEFESAVSKKRQNGVHLQWRLCIYQHHSENVYHHQERQFFHLHQPSSFDPTSHVQGGCVVCLPSIPHLGFLAILSVPKINKTITAFINQPCRINSGP